jgi:hypothetical protein
MVISKHGGPAVEKEIPYSPSRPSKRILDSLAIP